MANTSDSFIEEVSEEARRERFSRWLRRYGWMVALGLVLVVALAAWIEWRQAQARAAAELRGEALLTALEVEDQAGRIEALSELPAGGEGSLVGTLLLAAEHEAAGDGDAARAAYAAVAADAAVPPLYRDLAMLKAMMIAVGDGEAREEDVANLEALAQPGAPFRLLAREAIATAELAAGDADAALASLAAIAEDADVTESQRARVEALQVALGAPVASAPTASDPAADAAAPVAAGE